MPPPMAGWVYFKKHYTCSDPDNNRSSFYSINHPYYMSVGQRYCKKTTVERVRYRIYMASLFELWKLREIERGERSQIIWEKICIRWCIIYCYIRGGELADEIAYCLSPQGIQSLVLWRDYLIATTRISLIR